MARILFLAHRIPYPPNKGDKIRSWHFFRHLADRHTVHLGFYVDDKRDLKHIAYLKQQAASLCFETVGHFRQKMLALRGFLTGSPLSIAAYPHGRLGAYAKGLIARGEVDLVVLFSGATAPLVTTGDRFFADIPVVADLVDVDSAKWAAYAGQSGWPMSAVYAREGRRLAAFEAQVAKAAGTTLLVSDAEAALFRSRAGVGDVRAVPNGVDLNRFDPGRYLPPPERTAPVIIFTGAMDYQPNDEAVRWFVSRIWPIVRAELPDAIFRIAGGPNPSPVADLAGKGVEVLGYVDDMAASIADADIVVAPLLTARGLQNKVLEGMAMAKAVVATPAAHEGLAAVPGSDLICVSGADEFAAAVLRLWRDRRHRLALGAQARRYVEDQHQWSQVLKGLDDAVAAALGQGS